MKIVLFSIISLIYLTASAEGENHDSVRITTKDVVRQDSIHAIVVDMETGMRVANASVKTDRGMSTKTSWDGSFKIKDNFQQITVSCVGYMARRINREEVGDTISILSTSIKLNEVVVMGVNGRKLQFSFKGLDPSTAKLKANESAATGGANLLGLVGLAISKLKKDKTLKKEKLKKNLERY